MGQTSTSTNTDTKPSLDVFKAMRELREAGMESWARIALRVASSHTFSRLSSLLAKPGLIATGITRKRTEKAMTQLLAHANMPSRAEVLALSVRLTHIETALDDLAAAMESLRASGRAGPAAKRAPANDRVHRQSPPAGPTSQQEG
jgi:hypothetical protein